MVNKIIVSKILSDEEVTKLEGHWIDESYIKKKVINANTDVYYYEDENNLSFICPDLNLFMLKK